MCSANHALPEVSVTGLVNSFNLKERLQNKHLHFHISNSTKPKLVIAGTMERLTKTYLASFILFLLSLCVSYDELTR